jgi:hypothetical protein
VQSSSHLSRSGKPSTDSGSGLIGTRYVSLASIAACVKMEIVGSTIFLREISEPEENVLRLVQQEANANSETVSVKVGGTTIENLRRIESTERSRTFELRWNQYIAYSVRNESFALQDDSELHLAVC